MGAVYPRFASRLYPRRPVAVMDPKAEEEPIPLSVRRLQKWTGAISLLNAPPFPVAPPVAWEANPLGHILWEFQLHEFEWAWPLVNSARERRSAAETLTGLLCDYMGRVPFGRGAAYEPYPLSRRLVVWSAACRVLADAGADGGFMNHLASELDRGARFLAHTVERDLDNNHVVANAKALAFVGTLLKREYADVGYALMWEQLRAQVRPDGGHVENSTSYHFAVWRDGIETARLAQQKGVVVPDEIPGLLLRMGAFLSGLRRPDGDLPLLNDSVCDTFASLDTLLDAAAGPGQVPAQTRRPILYPESGYCILCAGDTHVLFDAGALGPDYCPGHGHADALSFELWANGRLRICDPGVYQYQAGEWRAYFRSTAAHSTLVVDDLDQSELAGSFRVGYMARARFTGAQLNQAPVWVRGEHDGYTRLVEPVVHRRTLFLNHAHELVVEDEVAGRGAHEFELLFHLAPGAQVDANGPGATARFEDNVRLDFSLEGAAQGHWAVKAGWYSPTWYVKQPAPVLARAWRATPPFTTRTRISIHPEHRAD